MARRNFLGSASPRGSLDFVNAANGAAVPNIANMSDLQNFQVTWNQWELTTQSLYDSAAYPAAGLNSIAFFTVPIGQGTGFGGGSKTISDTNLRLASQLPQGQMFIVTSVEVEVQPTTPTVAAGMPAAFGAQAAAVQINDSYIIGRSGNAALNILAKTYLTESPIGRLPPTSDFFISSAALSDATTAAAASQSRIAFGNFNGVPYVLTPNNLLIPSNTNFAMTLSWPEGLQAITNPARIFVRLNGMQARLAQ